MSTVSTLRSNVYQMLAEVDSDANKRVTPQDILNEINAAYVEVCRETDILQEDDISMSAVVGQSLYTLPAGMYNIKSVSCEPATAPLALSTQDDIVYRAPGWKNASNGTPTDVFMFDGRKFGVYPPPAAGQGPFHLDGYVVPSGADGAPVALLAADSDEPAFNAAFHKVLEFDAAMRICMSKLADSPVAKEKAIWAKSERDRMVAEMLAFRKNGLGLSMQRG